MSFLEELLGEGSSLEDRVAQVMALQPQQPSSLQDVGRAMGGMMGNMPMGGGPYKLAHRIGHWIDRMPGFTVAGLEGYKGTPQISSGHITNSQHYTGHAADVGYSGGGRFPSEMAALDWLEKALQRRYGNKLTELIWREPDHFDHLHYGTRPGG